MRGILIFFLGAYLTFSAENRTATANEFSGNFKFVPEYPNCELDYCDYRASDIRLDLNDRWKRIWFLAQGSFLDNVNEQNESSDFNAYSYAFSIGTDRQWNDNIFYGYGLTANRVRMNSKGTSEGETKTVLLNGHIRLNFLKLTLDLDAGLGYAENTRERSEQQGLYRGNYNSLQWHGSAELAWTLEQGFAKFQPFAGIRYSGLEESSYRENAVYGADFRRRSPGHYSGSSTVSMIGMRYFWSKEGQNAVITPNISVAWVHEFDESTIFSSNEFSNGPIFYRYMDTGKPKDRACIGGGLTASMRKCMDVYFRYNAELAKNYGSHGIILGMNWNF